MSKHTIVDVLHMAGHLLADERRHHSRWFAADERGQSVSSESSAACRWCYWGAVFASSTALGVPWFGSDSMPDGLDILPREWDLATPTERLEMARKLREAT